jgi:hypothetical protein
MEVHFEDALPGLGLYALVCVLAAASGYGLLKLLRPRIEHRLGVILAPVLGLAFWAVALGILGAFSVPVRVVAPWLWGATALLAVYGLQGRLRALVSLLLDRSAQARSASEGAPLPRWRFGLVSASAGSGVRGWPLLGLCLVLPVLCMWRAFPFGLTEYCPSLANDGWSYVAAAEYHWEFGRRPVAERGHFHDTGFMHHQSRYISYSLLALFSSLYKNGDTIYVGALHQAFCLFCTVCALLFFWLTQRSRVWVAITATAATVLCGWCARVVWFNNYDNSLLLPLMPALAGLLGVMSAADWRARLACGVLLAAALYIYPEGVPVGLAGVALVHSQRLWRQRRQWWPWLATTGTVVGTALLLVLPAGKLLYVYAKTQLTQVDIFVTSGNGGPIPGLYDSERFLPAAWGLSGWWSVPGDTLRRKEMRCALALTCLLGLGLLRLVWRRQGGLLAALVLFLGGAGYMVWSKHCDYGAFKVLNLGWWCIVAGVVAGAEAVVVLVRFRPLQTVAVAGGLWLIGCYAYLTLFDVPMDSTRLCDLRLSEFQQIDTLRAVVGNEPVIDACEDWLASLNSRFFHRSLNPYPVVLRGIVRFCLEPWRNARPISPRTRYLLAEAAPGPISMYLARSSTELVATAGPYNLWRLDPDRRGAHLLGIDNPAYGYWGNQGLPTFWMGRDQTTLHILSARPGTGVCQFWCSLGPCLPGVPTRTLKVVQDGAAPQQFVLREGRECIRFPVRPGINSVRLQVMDKPTRTRASAEDWRLLMLLVAVDTVELAPEEPTSAGSPGPTPGAVVTPAPGPPGG